VLRQDVHPEAYTHLVVTAAIGTLAIGDRANAMVSPEPDRQAQLRELVRIAHTSLHIPRIHRQEET
jgi:hypothetical protein